MTGAAKVRQRADLLVLGLLAALGAEKEDHRDRPDRDDQKTDDGD
jgi:hypothetical protein